jgi:hypothetical protein
MYQHIAEWRILCTACEQSFNAVVKMNTSTGTYHGSYCHEPCKLPGKSAFTAMYDIGKNCFTLDMLRDRLSDEGFELIL